MYTVRTTQKFDKDVKVTHLAAERQTVDSPFNQYRFS